MIHKRKKILVKESSEEKKEIIALASNTCLKRFYLDFKLLGIDSAQRHSEPGHWVKLLLIKILYTHTHLYVQMYKESRHNNDKILDLRIIFLHESALCFCYIKIIMIST